MRLEKASFFNWKEPVKKRITSLVLSVVLVLLAVFILRNEKVVDAADNMALLENRHPGYWEYLRPEKMIRVPIVKGFNDLHQEDIENKNELKVFLAGNYDGVQVTSNGRSLHFEGKAEQSNSPGIADVSRITTGSYFVSIGYPLSNSNVSIFLEGWQGNEHEFIQTVNIGNYFYIDTAKYNKLKFTANIPDGIDLDFDITPVLYKISDDNIVSELDNECVWLNVDRDRITEADWVVFNRALKQSNINGPVLIYSDGTAYRLADGKWQSQSVDNLGRLLRGD